MSVKQSSQVQENIAPDSVSSMAEQLRHFLSLIYRQGESYELVTESRRNDKGKSYPLRSKQNIRTFGTEDITALKTLIQNTPDGAWITSNPIRTEIQGNAASDQDITDYRYVLVESDEISRAEQWQKLNELNLPIATVVWSGGKSLHALVRIEAGTDRKLYDERVRKLYRYLEDKQFKVDTANKVIPKSYLYDHYRRWTEESGYRPVALVKFQAAVKRAYPEIEEIRIRKPSDQMCWKGIRYRK